MALIQNIFQAHPVALHRNMMTVDMLTPAAQLDLWRESLFLFRQAGKRTWCLMASWPPVRPPDC